MERPVEFRCSNQRINGSLLLPYTGAPCIITLHGLESNKDSGKWPVIASTLYKKGYGCLRFTFRGCGEEKEKSEGNFEDITLSARIEDYKSALRFIEDTKEVDVDRLGVIGSSFGGMVAIAAQKKRIKAAVTLATPYKISFERLQTLREGNYYVLPSGRRFKRGLYDDLLGYDLLKAVRDSPPILIIHGSEDDTVPLKHAYKLYENASQPKRLEILQGGDHIFSRSEHLSRAIELSIKWFREFL